MRKVNKQNLTNMWQTDGTEKQTDKSQTAIIIQDRETEDCKKTRTEEETETEICFKSERKKIE